MTADLTKSIVVMGVSGCGKSTIARMIAEKYDLAFIEGDQLHSQSNRDKMANGIPLTDADRHPWLSSIADQLRAWRQENKSGVVSCSSLKKTYRELLRTGDQQLQFLFLKGDEATLTERVSARKDHFMPISLLKDQLATLESPEQENGVITINIKNSPADILKLFDQQQNSSMENIA